jgi:2-polyprenyl-3-methyl-5-hydroxy-6-metoxy-1,4-benzoquinol methylase
LYSELTDVIFATAPGKWDFWGCKSCSSGYLSPRPTRETIHIAYEDYYTHNAVGEETKSAVAEAISKLRLSLINGYRNRIFNAGFAPAIGVGYQITRLRPHTARVIQDDLRYLPKIREGTRPRLLDVGCGNGGFLKVAAQGGWQAFGCDPDPKVEEFVSKESNVFIRVGGHEVFLDEAGSFDIVTSSHVIEHVHDPIHELKGLFQLLKPGGFLYLDTPNIGSFGHQFWSKYWLGLDAPRHLTLPSRSILEDLLQRLGFRDIQFIQRPGAWKSISLKSARLKIGRRYNDGSADHELKLPIYRDESPESSEFLTVTCVKPTDA